MIADLSFELTSDLEMVRDAARRVVTAGLAEDRRAPNGNPALLQLAEMGWLACALPEAQGGIENGMLGLCLVAQEMGRGLATAPFVALAGFSAVLLEGLGGEPAQRLLSDLVAGRAAPVVALGELVAPEHGFRAERCAEGWRLSGGAAGVIGGPAAGVFLALARDAASGKLMVFSVPADASGLVCDHYATFDGRLASNIGLDAVLLDEQQLLSGERDAAEAFNRALDVALVASSAEMLGAIERAFDLTRDYLNTRRQFGQTIGEFQVLRHRLADMYIEIEQARSMLQLGATALAGCTGRERARFAAAVKARVSQSARYVAGQAVQLHGGIGITEEASVGPIFKRFVAFDLWLGSGRQHTQRFAELSAASGANIS